MYNKGSYFFKKWTGRAEFKSAVVYHKKTCNEKCIEWFPFTLIQGFNQHADAV